MASGAPDQQGRPRSCAWRRASPSNRDFPISRLSLEDEHTRAVLLDNRVKRCSDCRLFEGPADDGLMAHQGSRLL